MKRLIIRSNDYLKAWTMYGPDISYDEYGKAVDNYHRHLKEDFSPFEVYEYSTDYHTPGNARLIQLDNQEWLFRLDRSWQWGPSGRLFGPYPAGYFTPVTYSDTFPGTNGKYVDSFPDIESAIDYLKGENT